MQHSSTPRRSPSKVADRVASSDTGPPSWIPAYQSGMCRRRQREQDVVVRGHAGGEDRAEDDPNGDHDQRHDQVVLEPARPGGIAAPVGDDEGEHGQDEDQQHRVGGAADGGHQPDRPDPPGDRVQRARDPGVAARRGQRGDHRSRFVSGRRPLRGVGAARSSLRRRPGAGQARARGSPAGPSCWAGLLAVDAGRASTISGPPEPDDAPARGAPWPAAPVGAEPDAGRFAGGAADVAVPRGAVVVPLDEPAVRPAGVRPAGCRGGARLLETRCADVALDR